MDTEANRELEEMDTRYCECEVHGSRQRAYLVCNHILAKHNRSLIVHLRPWKDIPNGNGEMFCAKPNHTANEFSVVCEKTLLQIGLLLPGERLVQ